MVKRPLGEEGRKTHERTSCVPRMTVEQQAVKLTEVEQRSRSNTRRIDKLEQSTEALNSLASSVEVMANEQRHQTEAMLDIKQDVAALDRKVETLEHKPAKRWETVTDKIVVAVTAALVGFVLAQIGIT